MERKRNNTEEFAYNSKTDSLDDRPLTPEHEEILRREIFFGEVGHKMHIEKAHYSAAEYDAIAWREFDSDDEEQQKFLNEWLDANLFWSMPEWNEDSRRINRGQHLNRPEASVARFDNEELRRELKSTSETM